MMGRLALLAALVAAGGPSLAAELGDDMVPARPRAEPALPDALTPRSPESVLGPATALPDNPAAAQAWRQLLQQLFPLTPEQVRALRDSADRQARAIAEPVAGPLRPATRALSLRLAPGEALPRLRLHPGNATTLVFSDATGAPWPVRALTLGNPQAFAASIVGEEGISNIVVISPLVPRIAGANLVVALAEHPVPLVFAIEGGDADVDYRVDVTVQARGPRAVSAVAERSAVAPTRDAALQAFLDGTPPREARTVPTSTRDIEAWLHQGRLVVRSRQELVSPAYEARARHVSGVTVYMLDPAPVLLVSDQGRLIRVEVSLPQPAEAMRVQRGVP